MSKRYLALLLALTLMLSLLTGCASQTQDSQTEEAATETTAEDGEAAQQETQPPLELTDEIRSDPVAYVTDGAIHMGDTVMSVDGTDITAGAFFYMLAYQYYQASSMYASYGIQLDVSQPMDEDGTSSTLADYMVQLAKEDCQRNVALQRKAQELGLELDEALEAQMEELKGYLTDQVALFYVSTKEDMEQVTRASLLGSRISDYYFGENGTEVPSDATLTDYANEHGNYTCRYILLRTDDLQEDDAEGKAAQQAKAQELYDQMAGLAGEELLTAFAKLQEENNADGNTEPFSFDENSSLVSGFREKIAELKPGELGLTDETDYGFFVVLRLEPDLDQVRETYISERYDAMIGEWQENSPITTTQTLDDLDFIAALGRMQALQTAVQEELAAQQSDEAPEEATETAAGTGEEAETAEAGGEETEAAEVTEAAEEVTEAE